MFAEYPRAQASYWVPNLAMALDHKKGSSAKSVGKERLSDEMEWAV